MQRNMDSLNSTPNEILLFLTDKFQNGASYGTLNSMRSAISLISPGDVGNNPLISRFFKGIFRLRPSLPKYSQTWNTEIALNAAANLDPLEMLNREQLTNKLVILLALGTAHRVQTLSLIKIDNIQAISSQGVEIKISDLIKTSRPGSVQPTFFLPFFAHKPEVCVARTIVFYLNFSKEDRKEIKNLILTTKKPYRAATAQTISRWIRAFLISCGISQEFSAHSTRHAATSAALKKGLDIRIIKSTAGWSQESKVFAKFYNRPILPDKGAFAAAILE